MNIPTQDIGPEKKRGVASRGVLVTVCRVCH